MIELSLTLSILAFQRIILVKEVYERSNGFREYFKIMGMNSGVNTMGNMIYGYTAGFIVRHS